jgi:arylsulfatase A-like enzyme
MNFIESLDPARNIVVITGDHGESFGADGTLVHGSRASEAQVRTPMVMVGPGIPSRVVDAPTRHMDLLPTLLHAATGNDAAVDGLEGRSLLGSAPLEDRVLLSPYRARQPEELVLIRGNQRLLFRVRTDRPELEAFSFVDETGLPDLNADPQELGRAEDWAHAMRLELERLAAVRTP